MATVFTGTGDPARSMALLWRGAGDPARRPGPRPELDVDRVVVTAVAVADAEGLGALSMRRISAALGVGTMTLYTYVPGKGELVDLMYDHVLGELYPDTEGVQDASAVATAWRGRLEGVAHANRDLFRRHPWALHVATGRPPLGPNLMTKYEKELQAVDGLGLTEVEMDLLISAVTGFVRGTVTGAQEKAEAEHATGITDEQWWASTAPYVEKVFDPARFPTAARVGPVAGQELQAAYDPDRSFTFGLQRLLDGVEAFVAARSTTP